MSSLAPVSSVFINMPHYELGMVVRYGLNRGQLTEVRSKYFVYILYMNGMNIDINISHFMVVYCRWSRGVVLKYWKRAVTSGKSSSWENDSYPKNRTNLE